MSDQPHDRASPLDHVPVLDDPRFLIQRRPRNPFYLRKRQRSAAGNAWATLDHLRRGPGQAASVSTEITYPAIESRLRREVPKLPLRFVGHAAVVGLVLIVVVTRGLPALALGMDWSQGATVATDNVVNEAEDAEHTNVAAPVVLAHIETAHRVAPANEMQDSLVPSLLPRQVAPSSAFIATHTVAVGEKLGQIAERYKVSVMALIGANTIDHKMLAIGQQLRIPRVSGLPHKVVEGETIESIAEQHDVASSAIRFFPPNNLGSGRALLPGEELFIPGAKAIGTGPSEAEAAEATAIPVGAVIDDETRIRIGPGTDYEKVAKLPSEVQVALLGRHDSWFQIRTPNGTEGWISADLLAVGDGIADEVPQVLDVPDLPLVAVQPAEPTEAQPQAQPQPEVQPAPKPVVKSQAVRPSSGRWVWPTSGDLTSGFG